MLTIWDTVRASLWALPLATGASAYLALRINISVRDDPALHLHSGGAKETPQFLSNLVSSMMQA
jgi:hypothetical protein